MPIKVSALNANFSSPNADLRCLKHESVKEGYPLKSGYFTDTGSSNMKTVADRHRHPTYHNMH